MSEPNPKLEAAVVSPRRHLAAVLAIAFLVGLDLWSKQTIMPWLEARMTAYQHHYPGPPPEPALVRDSNGYERYPIAGNWLAWMHNLNYGAAFGRGGGMQKILVPGRGVAILVLLVLILRAPPGRKLYFTALILVASGAIGNLYDNLFYKPIYPDETKPFGPVRDFIDVYFEVWDWHFPTFNVADACISVGVAFLLLSTLLAPEEETRASAEESGEPSSPGAAS